MVLRINVCADDWTAETAIIASNVYDSIEGHKHSAEISMYSDKHQKFVIQVL